MQLPEVLALPLHESLVLMATGCYASGQYYRNVTQQMSRADKQWYCIVGFNVPYSTLNPRILHWMPFLSQCS